MTSGIRFYGLAAAFTFTMTVKLTEILPLFLYIGQINLDFSNKSALKFIKFCLKNIAAL